MAYIENDQKNEIPKHEYWHTAEIVTEDVWFLEQQDCACISGDAKDVTTIWDYSRGGDQLTLEVKFKIDALEGADGKAFEDIDLSAMKAIFESLGVTEYEKLDVKISDEQIDIKISARGIELTDDEVYALPDEVWTSIVVRDEYGAICEIEANICFDQYKPHSPIAFDLNGDGRIGVTGVSTAQVRADGEIGDTVSFDLDADGTAEQIEWLSGDGDALLVDNRDGAAAYDMDGARLFGDQGGLYANGYEKLSLLDQDGDGALTGYELQGLALWSDDGDAIVQAGELQSLDVYGIVSISTGYNAVENARGESLMQSSATISQYVPPPGFAGKPGHEAPECPPPDESYEPDPSGRLMLTEDVWFLTRPEGHCLYGSEDGVKTEWDYHRGGDKLELEVKFKIDALFDKDSGVEFHDVDVAAYRAIFESLGADEFDKLEIKVSDDEIKIKMAAEGIELTDDEVHALPKQIGTPVFVKDAYGEVQCINVTVCIDKAKAHSPIAFDLNGDGQIGVTGTSTAQDRVDEAIGRTVTFDLDADGSLDSIEWLSGDGDALLVDNRDGNAASDMDGARLFGDQGGLFENGYEKLALLDQDGDGALIGDELDGLVLWVDNGDAIVDAGELQALSQYGVVGIATGYSTVTNALGEELIQSAALIDDGFSI